MPFKEAGSYKKYYEEHKDELKAKMRQRDAERRQKIKEECETDPAVLERERQRMRAKYHTNINNKVKKILTEMSQSPNIAEPVKTICRNFLANNTFAGLTVKWCEDLKKVAWVENKDATREEEDFRVRHSLDDFSDSEGTNTGNSGGEEGDAENSEVEG
jgi:signal recognition particle GTPase